MYEGSDGHLILLNHPEGFKRRPSSCYVHSHPQSERAQLCVELKSVSLCTFFWGWQMIIKPFSKLICLHYLICSILNKLPTWLKAVYIIDWDSYCHHFRSDLQFSSWQHVPTQCLLFIWRRCEFWWDLKSTGKNLWKADYQLSGKWWSLQAIKTGLFAYCR